MEAVTLAARLDGLHPGKLVDRLAIATLGSSSLPLSLPARCAVTWGLMYIGALVLYFSAGVIDTVLVALLRRVFGGRKAGGGVEAGSGGGAAPDVWREIRFSVWSLAVMSGLSVPLEVGVQLGYSRIYHDAAEYSKVYLFLSPFLFVVLSDCAIYFIHRGLHHRLIYKYIHKPHHSFVTTSAFAAFAFHPVDGFLQGVPYQLFVYVIPFHAVAHVVSMSLVLLWTVNIHDRASLGIPFVNCAAHHTVHHTTFKSNYGQYLTLWDRVFGTFRDPNIWEKLDGVILSDKIVYGKDS
jgi:Delta7-sterol 5-desaturase